MHTVSQKQKCGVTQPKAVVPALPAWMVRPAECTDEAFEWPDTRQLPKDVSEE